MPPGRIRDYTQTTEVEGLKELRAEMRKAGPEMAKKLQQVNKKLVERVATRAKGRFYATVSAADGRAAPLIQKPSGRGSISRSRESIRPNATQTSASIVGGGPKAPGFFGHEFGGGARPTTRQFPIHRGRDGYVLYPTVRQEMRTASKEWEEIFDEVFEQGG